MSTSKELPQVSARILLKPDTLLPDDETLLVRAGRFEPQALAAIHDRFYPDIFRYLVFKTGDPLIAEDLASDVFMHLLDALRAGRIPNSLPAWLFGVAAHKSADYFRRQSRCPQTELSDELIDPADELDGDLLAGDTLQAMRQALQRLTDEQQQVLTLRFNQGRSIADTAAQLNKSESAVKQLQLRAFSTLRRMLEAVNGH